MGLIWSSAHGKVLHNSLQHEEKRESVQDDSSPDINDEDIFYETVDTFSTQKEDLVLQELENQNACLSNEELYTKSRKHFPNDEKIIRSDCSENCENANSIDSKSIASAKCEGFTSGVDKSTVWTAHSSPTEDLYTESMAVRYVSYQEEGKIHSQHQRPPKMNNNSRSTLETECNDEIQSVSPCKEEKKNVKECRSFSLPLIREEEVFTGRHAKSTSEPEFERPVKISPPVKSVVPSSCAWQIDVDCFKSKKRKKPPQKYLRSKDNTVESEYNDGSHRKLQQHLATMEIATQEMMERRKVLDLRRW